MFLLALEILYNITFRIDVPHWCHILLVSHVLQIIHKGVLQMQGYRYFFPAIDFQT